MGNDSSAINMETITIPIEEYKVLLENVVRVKAFERFVNSREYGIADREICGIILGFEVEENAAD